MSVKNYDWVYAIVKELSNCHWILSKLILDDNYDILVKENKEWEERFELLIKNSI